MIDNLELQTLDKEQMTKWIIDAPDTESVTAFKPNRQIQKINLRFDIEKIRAALEEVLQTVEFQGGDGFYALP